MLMTFPLSFSLSPLSLSLQTNPRDAPSEDAAGGDHLGHAGGSAGLPPNAACGDSERSRCEDLPHSAQLPAVPADDPKPLLLLVHQQQWQGGFNLRSTGQFDLRPRGEDRGPEQATSSGSE